MIPATWDVPDFESDDPSAPGRPLPALVSLHFLRSALRRRWMACVLSAVLGLLAAAAFLVAFPAPHKAKAMLVLAHDPQVDPTRRHVHRRQPADEPHCRRSDGREPRPER